MRIGTGGSLQPPQGGRGRPGGPPVLPPGTLESLEPWNGAMASMQVNKSDVQQLSACTKITSKIGRNVFDLSYCVSL